MKKILIITDGQGWVVDRISQTFKQLIPLDITVINKSEIHWNEELVDKSKQYDIIHYNNSFISEYENVLKDIKCKQIVTIRSHRYNKNIKNVVKYMNAVHVINLDLQKEFKGSVYIPDGVFIDPIQAKKFVVGMAFQNIKQNAEYKGYNLVKKICDDLQIELRVVQTLSPDLMPHFYKGLNLFVCASENEGFSAPAMECLAMNVPVLTTNVGVPKILNCHKVDRTYESTRQGIERFYTTRQIFPRYSWSNVCLEMKELYESI